MIRIVPLLFVLLAANCMALAQETVKPVSQPILGAIRWDGWFQDNPWEKNLAPPQWHYRLPFFATKTDGNDVAILADAQDAMEREILEAKAGGLDYWAFCYYHPKSWAQADAYNYGWKRYLASPHKNDVNFCLLLQGGKHLGPVEDWDSTVAQFAAFFLEPSYQRVREGRPLLYVFACEHIIPHFGSSEAAGKAFRQLREASIKMGAGDPYIVAQIWLHQMNADFLDAVKFDGLSAYSAHGGEGTGESYAKLMDMNRYYWDRFKETGREVVPLVNAGWDGRPRNYPGNWYETAKPEEFVEAVRRSFAWLEANPGAAPARTVLVYAWNEFDEGGWLCPTLQEGAARLEALRKIRGGKP